MGVVVKQAGQRAAALQVDLAGAAAGQRQHLGITAHRYKLAIADGHGAGRGLGLVQRGEAAVVKDGVGAGGGHGSGVLGGW